MAVVIAKVREQYRNEVFSKVRGYPVGDPKRCRAQHGTRPGFAQLEAVWATLPLIQSALEAIDAGDLNTAFERAHSLKGVMGNVALTPLFEPISEITEELRARNDIDYSGYLDRIFTELEKFRSL